MSRSVWKTLGIPAGSDRAAIRRGYAAKLRQTNPEDDPEGFKTLRAAYDQALAMADARAWQAEHGGDADDWAEDEYDDSAREAVFTATLMPDQLDAALTEPAPPPPISPDAHLLDGRERDLADFEARMNALAGQMTSPWAQDDVALEAAFRHVLASPAMAEIGIRAHAEEWIAGLLASNIPKSDVLLLQAIEAFGWDGASCQRGQSPAVAAILHRIDEWRTIEALTSHGDQYHFAFTELTKPPRGEWSMRLTAINPGVAPRIRTLVDYSEWQMPGLRHSFNADTLMWWREHLSRPRMTLGRLLLAPALFIVLLALGAIFKPPAPWNMVLLIAGALASLALPWLHLVTIGRLTHARDTGDGSALPSWAERGWIVPIFALPVAAMFVPPSPIWAVAALLVAALGMQWTQLATGGKRWRETGESAFAWILTIGVYGFFGFVPFLDLPPHTMLLLCAVAALVIHARVVAIDRLLAIGEPLTQRFKVPGPIALAILSGVALFSPLSPLFIAGAAFAVTALLVNAMFHGQIGWLRYATRVAIAIAFLGASAVSMPDKPSETAPRIDPAQEAPQAERISSLPLAEGERMPPSLRDVLMPKPRSAAELEADLLREEPGLAQIREGNPELFARVREILRRQSLSMVSAADARAEIGTAINTEHARKRDGAPDALLAEGVRLQLAKRVALGARSAPACAEENVPPFDTLYPDTIIERQNALVYAIVAAPPQKVRRGTPIPAERIVRTATDALDITPAELNDRLRGNGGDYHVCQARIANLRAITEESDADIAATLRAN